jgi:hypothetical protein
MAPNNQQQQAAAAAAAVRLPDFHADSRQCWFDCLDSTFATANITQLIRKFHWAMSKLPFSLTPTVRPLSRDPTAVAVPYRELKELLLPSYGLTDEQRTSKWLDYPMCSGDTRPSVLWDNLTALQPATLKEAQVALFLRKLPRHISALINTRSFDTTEEMIQRCNALWTSQTPEEAASAAAGPWQHSSLRNARRPPADRRRCSPTPGAAKGGRNDGLCFYHSHFGNKAHKCERGCTRKTNRPAAGPQFAAAAGPIPACHPPSVAIPELVTAMSAFPTKNLIFLIDSKNNFNFLVDSGASISILPHSSSAPPTGPHLVGANGNIVPVWGRPRQIVTFASQDFEFDFFFAAVATPIIGMDFLTKFELPIIPAKRQVLHVASGRTLTQAILVLLLAPGAPRPPPPSPPSRPRYKSFLRNSRRYCDPAPHRPSHSTV